MIIQILERTPGWVLLLFVLLLTLGLSQTRTREVSRARATALPAVMMMLSLAGVLSTFTHALLAVSAWVVGLVLSLELAGPLVVVQGASWSAETECFRIPGSWLPLGLIVGLFTIKYVTGIVLAIHPALTSSSSVAVALSLLYGAFAGFFRARERSLAALRQNSP